MATNVNSNTALIQVDVQTAPKTVTLPSAAANSGRFITVKDKFNNAAVNNITIQPLGGDTIDGTAGNYVLSNSGAAVGLVSDGISRWMTMNSPATPFTGSTITLSSATVNLATLGMIDQATNQLSNVTLSSGILKVENDAVFNGQIYSLSSVLLNFDIGVGTDLTLSTLTAQNIQTSTLSASNTFSKLITGSTITGQYFIGDGSQLSNLVLPSTTVLLASYSMFTVSTNTAYTQAPWGSQLLELSTLAIQKAPVFLDPNGITIRVSTPTAQPFRISYMTGGNQDTTSVVRPTLTLAISTPTNQVYYPSVENFEGGGGSVSFLETLDSDSQLLFYTRGLSNYTFTPQDTYLYRMTIELLQGQGTDLFSTQNVWNNTNIFTKPVFFYDTVTITGITNLTDLYASNSVTVQSNLTVNSNLAIGGNGTFSNNLTVLQSSIGNAVYGTTVTSQSTIANAVYTNFLTVINNGLIGPASIQLSNDTVSSANITVSSISILDQSTLTYKPLVISSGALYVGGTLASAAGSGGGGGVGGSTLSSLFVGSSSNENFIKFWGQIGEYNNTVIAHQSTGDNTAELIFFRGSSISDQIRLQTTGNIRFETGVSAPRNFCNEVQVSPPSLLINAASNVGILTETPQFTLDVTGSGRFTTLLSTPSLYAGSLQMGVFFA